jgi:hypothetical protein
MPESRTQCPCDCHRADSGGLVCGKCWRNHGPHDERRVIEDVPLILRAFAAEMDDEDDDDTEARQ